MKKKTYLQQSLNNGKILRWMDGLMPLRFYIAPFRFYSKIEEDYKYRGMVIKALNEWQSCSGGKVSFQVVDKLHESQINLDWKRVDRQALGQCYFHFDSHQRLYSAEIQIGISDGVIHQNYMSEDEVYHTILHEIGHSLGLGHSPNDDDIMYTPHKYGVVNLSKGDKLSIQWLYKLGLGATPSEIASRYGVKATDLDDVIVKLIEKKIPSEFEKVKNSIGDESSSKDLLQEQQNIADLKKYNIALQHIKIPEEMRKIFVKQHSKFK